MRGSSKGGMYIQPALFATSSCPYAMPSSTFCGKENIQMIWYISPPPQFPSINEIHLIVILYSKCNLWVNKMKHIHSESTTLIHSFVLGKSKKVTEEHLTNLAMNDHSGSLIPHFLHCYVRCDVWDNDSCRNPELAGRISCCHAGISSYWNKQTNKQLN